MDPNDWVWPVVVAVNLNQTARVRPLTPFGIAMSGAVKVALLVGR